MVRQVTMQATTLAFGDAYLITFFAALLAIPLALMLPVAGQLELFGSPSPSGDARSHSWQLSLRQKL